MYARFKLKFTLKLCYEWSLSFRFKQLEIRGCGVLSKKYVYYVASCSFSKTFKVKYSVDSSNTDECESGSVL